MSFIIGLISCAVLLAAFLSGGGNPALLLDWRSLVLVAGGTAALGFMGGAGGSFAARAGDAARAMRHSGAQKLEEELLSLARLAREKGVLALEAAEERVSNVLVRQGLRLISASAGQETVRSVLYTRADGQTARERAAQEWLEHLAYLAVGVGVVGTLLKTIFMLRRYTGPKTLASGFAGALLPVVYGVLLAYIVLLPLAARVRSGSVKHQNFRKAAVEGILAVQAGESLFVVQERLHTILQPDGKKADRAAG